MRFQFPDGQIVMLDRPFSREGVNYPAEWLRQMSAADRIAFGLTELPEPEAPVTPAAPAVRVATARQFKAALALSGVITEAEVASPNLPAVAEPVVAQFPQEQRIVARSTWANMTVVPEDDPLLEAMRLAAGMTEAEKTALFDLALSIA
jgi:hypothetical protein